MIQLLFQIVTAIKTETVKKQSLGKYLKQGFYLLQMEYFLLLLYSIIFEKFCFLNESVRNINVQKVFDFF